jgi:hypothetical protein
MISRILFIVVMIYVVTRLYSPQNYPHIPENERWQQTH